MNTQAIGKAYYQICSIGTLSQNDLTVHVAIMGGRLYKIKQRFEQSL